jgi:predicted regulator of Ras-like GTPase activity (Roadblock/LC7/MglB family)
MSFPGVLGALVTAPGARGAAFLDPQGQVVAASGEDEVLETIGAYQSVWLGELGRAADRAGLGEVIDLTMDFRDARILTAGVKDGYFLVLVTDRGGILAPTRAKLDEARRLLAAEIF